MVSMTSRALGLGRGDDLGGEGMDAAGGRISDDLGQAAAVARLGQDPQPLGEEQAFLPRRAFLSRSARRRLTVSLEKR